MHAMIVDSRPTRLDLTQIAFLEAGIHVTGSGSPAVADCCLRRAVVDLLVLDAEVAGRRTGEIIALAERRNPRLVTLVLTRNVASVTDTYTEVFQSVHCVLEADVPPAMVARMAQASLAGRTIARVAAAKSMTAEGAPDAAGQVARDRQRAPDMAPGEVAVAQAGHAPSSAPADGAHAGAEPSWPEAGGQEVAAPVAPGPASAENAPFPSSAADATMAPAPRQPALAQGLAGQPAAAGQGGPPPVFATRRRRVAPHHQLMAMGA
ncbi:hypothetical protein [Ponticoccus litoralis]|uniref:Response regulatory domain-containing protein n=1 Tax=Ponticoccus litoralis TaxID=422297 RepID=A0AAW9SDV9_9RHOB